MNDIIWKQVGNRISFNYKELEIYFDMPDGYKLEDTHIDLLHLAEIILLSPWDEEIINRYKDTFTRKFGIHNSLSFSTGADSTAAMLLLPDSTLLSYHYRDFKSGLVHDNALRFINKLKEENKDVLVIPSNHELIRTLHGLPVGFSTDFACLVHLVLLADYLHLKSISTGMVLESAYLGYGDKFRMFNNIEYRNKWKQLFESCGLYLNYPTAGLSEIITTKIVQSSKYKDYAYSCLRKLDGCNNCYKCFRKNLLNGENPIINNETMTFISKRPPKMAVSIIYACQKNNIILEPLKEYMDMDLSFLERYYGEYLELNDNSISDFLKNKLKEYGIENMTSGDIIKLQQIDIQ
jgi:hypothetical protein